MLLLQTLFMLAAWLISGHAIERVYTKAGFVDTPRFVFWLPALNLAFLVYLAFAQWPSYRDQGR